eukprot:123310-Chlamydomonas_euryale.AAC.1
MISFSSHGPVSSGGAAGGTVHSHDAADTEAAADAACAAATDAAGLAPLFRKALPMVMSQSAFYDNEDGPPLVFKKTKLKPAFPGRRGKKTVRGGGGGGGMMHARRDLAADAVAHVVAEVRRA